MAPILILILILGLIPAAAWAGGGYGAPGVAAGSLRLPEGNDGPNAARPGLSAWKGALAQQAAGLTLASGREAQASFAIVRLPRDKRYEGRYGAGVFGTPRGDPAPWALSYGYDSLAPALAPGRFTFARGGSFAGGNSAGGPFAGGGGGDRVAPVSALWNEDEALVVLWSDGQDRWQLDWYSLITGERHPGDPVTAARGVAALSLPDIINIGSTGRLAAYAANGASDDKRLPWPGQIRAVGHVEAAIPPATWAAIALGRPLRDALPADRILFLRDFDGTPGSLAAPDWATPDGAAPDGAGKGSGGGDRTAPAQPVGSRTPGVPPATLLPGTTFLRQSMQDYALIRMASAGQVFGLMAGTGERSVPFSGLASGPVDLRVLEAETGRVVRDWTRMAAYADGGWSGALTLPESTNGWLFADVRLRARPEVIGHWREEFGVGWKFQLVGQSNVNTAMRAGRVGVAIVEPMGASFVDNVIRGPRKSEGAAARAMTMVRIGMAAASDGQVMFVNQIRRYRPRTPIMIYHDAVNGTPMRGFLRGEYSPVWRGDRHYTDMTDKYAAYGRDISVQVFQWGLSDSITRQSIRDLMQAWLTGTGPEARGIAIAPMADLPGTRFSLVAMDRGGVIREDAIDKTESRLDFVARQPGLAAGISPPVSDYRIADDDLSAHASPDHLEGGARWAGRAAVGAARALGWDRTKNPYYGAARLSADRRTILIDCVAVNGGRITSPAPDRLRGWFVKEQADRDWVPVTSGRFTARLVEGVVRITRSEGIWPRGVRVYRRPANEDRGRGDGATEDALHAGSIYESWEGDAMDGLVDGRAGGTGLPVIGQMVAGQWRLRYEAAPAAP